MSIKIKHEIILSVQYQRISLGQRIDLQRSFSFNSSVGATSIALFE